MGKLPLMKMIPRLSSKGSTSRWVGGVEVFTIGGVEYVKGSPASATAVTPSGEVSLRLFRVVPKALCIRHKKYMGKRKPRTNCQMCWEAYEQT